ncbi:MAG: hypothetical protein OIN66_18845, partial [Candidatus Methanoperedens sp.]|nr:hypothetical protein [Candidatus Methanoperedens sp.]
AGCSMAQYPGSIVGIVPSRDAEYYVFASTHKSASNSASLTVHTPGNWGAAALGGMPRTLNIAFASKLKAAAQKLAELAPALPGWQVSVEVDHHGPSLAKPVLFVEIGSTEAEWKNPVAGEIAAKAILAAVQSREEFPVHVGFGGSHYAPKFTPRILKGSAAFGHIISGYSLERDGVDEEMVRQAMERNVEKIESAMIDWKGIKKEQKDALVAILESLGAKWEKA